jgi:predicted phosphodiesterase
LFLGLSCSSSISLDNCDVILKLIDINRLKIELETNTITIREDDMRFVATHGHLTSVIEKLAHLSRALQREF